VLLVLAVRVLVREVNGLWLRMVVIRSPHRIGLLLVVVVAEDPLVPPLPSRIRKKNILNKILFVFVFYDK
jgi:hypothetical protein